MELDERIRAAAQQLGQALRQDARVRAYLDALEETQSDPEASVLEKKMYEAYKGLITCQQVCEQLDPEVARSFYDLRQQVQTHPLISKRYDMLSVLQPHLNEVAEEINFVLGVDFSAMAKP
jgi:cell fate (sporulation/competence/biofilm development) regulator YlbF (YheA/YmcA/DUF963 family)